MIETFGQRVVAALRTAAQAPAAGDQVAPCPVLWVDWDPDRNDTVRWQPEIHPASARTRASKVNT